MEDKPFIYFDKLKLWDVIIITIYLIFSIYAFFIYQRGSDEAVTIVVSTHVVISQIGSFMFLYKLLRNFTFYLIWFGFAILHALMYFLIVGHRQFEMESAKHYSILLNTIVLLLVFQAFRYFSLKTQKREFRVPVSRFEHDLPNDLKTSDTDAILVLTYLISAFLLLNFDDLF